MRKEIERTVEVPEGFSVGISGNSVTIKGNGKELSREFDLGRLSMELSEGKIKIYAKNGTRREAAMAGTIRAHLKNMINGLKEDFVYKLEICNVHFPMNVKVEGDKLVIKSFLGERKLRYAKILDGVKVEVNGNVITVSSHNKESAGQTAANIEKATKIKSRDRRIFQDGIFITEKCGRKI
ncbi:50S ribosomal protein L6 [Candidatus Pacearchaeota archaeon]|nr:MAG: 50S ribosomal protein L6 [Candidatus Pacearchaeota archaeon]